jgi:uncharacterized protein YbcV (DUF1398 family)
MNTKVMHDVAVETQQGKITFPEVVARLLEVGVESYFVDFASAQKTYYLTNGSTHTEPMIFTPDQIAPHFSQANLIAAIRGAQADTVRYPEFVKRSTAAGVIGYWAFLTGRRVIYWSRKGEQHIEEFPQQ